MAKVGDPQSSRIPLWPWGGPRSIREKLVDPAQFDRKKKAKKLGDPKRPPLASAALLEFMGPGHTSDELRLPPPPSPFGQGTEELTPFPDRAFTRTVVERGADGSRKALDAALGRVTVAPDKLERMKAVINREAQMLSLLGKVQADTDEVIERMKQEYKANGSY
ncbi:MAG: hypothetical protein QM765_46720 [Myxococcales bacterium]